MQKSLTTLSVVPPWSRVLTVHDGEVPLSRSRQQFLIALELEEMESRRCMILATPEKLLSPDAMDIHSRLRSLGYSPDDVEAATGELIATLYSQWREREEGSGWQMDNTETEEHFAHLVADADKRDASDIHIVCGRGQEQAMIRLRIHGRMLDYQKLSTGMAQRLCSCAYNSIAEDREVSFNPGTTQDANIVLRIKGVEYRLRYSHAPNHPHGFHAAIRILHTNRGRQDTDLRKLGFLPGQIRLLETMLQQPDGAIIIAGTTGSGKSTTISALLSWLYHRSQKQLNILTVEDPPEYDIDGAIQSPVVCSERERERGRNDFGNMVRASMRRDPDVLMIGEIRDLQTAISFIQAVQSGHLCITTLHARDSFAILSRLEGLGANMPTNPITRSLLCEPGFISGLLYQRLLPVLCDHCGSAVMEGGIRTRGSGCEHCRGGIGGRTVCAQIVRPDREMLNLMREYRDLEARQLWERRGAEDPLPVEQREHGLSACDTALHKMRQGLIAVEDMQAYFGYRDSVGTDNVHALDIAVVGGVGRGCRAEG